MQTVRFSDSGRELPVRKILCLGQNYAEHTREMAWPRAETPVVFLKPATALIEDGQEVIIPPFSNEVHHEVELVVALGQGGRQIPEGRALAHVAGYAVGLDMTLRDVQRRAKEQGQPWTVAKGFDTAAPVSLFVEASAVADPGSLELSLRVNGQLRQRGSTRDLLMPVERVIAYLSGVFTLEPGDLIFTGTPAGVGSVAPGDVLVAELLGLARLTVSVR